MQELTKLEERYAGLATMDRLPACVYIIDPKREQNAVREANRLRIPIAAICDTNPDPEVITSPIPGIDAPIRSIRLTTTSVADRIEAARHQAGMVTPLSASAS